MVKREIDCESPLKNISRNSKILITFNENQKPRNNGSCKFKINLLSKVLFIQPKNEYFNDITAPFDWKFIRLKNILFIFASLKSQDFVLVFKKEEICIKVFNGIFKKRTVDSVEHELLKDRFLNPLFKNASKNLTIKEILEEWIHKFEGNEKNEYLQLLKWHQENPEIDDNDNDIKDVKLEIDQEPVSRKRRHHQIENGKNNLSSDFEGFSNETIDEYQCEGAQTPSETEKSYSTVKFKKLIDESMFIIVRCKDAAETSRQLLIFTSQEKTHCYKYNFHSKLQVFNHCCCKNKQKGMKAILDFDENGNDCIKMEDKKHACTPILYEPEKYFEMKILKKPDYEVLENCAIKSKQMLIIFDLNDKNLCYEYYWSEKPKIYICCGCTSKRKKFTSTKIICHQNSENEYILFSKDEHVCPKRKYNREKYFSSYQIVLSPNFEIQTKIRNGNEIKTLIIFVGLDRKLCYFYSFRKITNSFYCNGCSGKTKKTRKNIPAKICKNDENEEYVILSNSKHVCSPRAYIPQGSPQIEEIILRPPKFKFLEANQLHPSKVFIFDSTNPEFCYIFSKINERRYYCLGCKAQRNKNDQTKQVVTVFLEKDDESNGEYFVRINLGERHICKPQKYQPEKYEIKILKPQNDYILFREKGKIRLVIYSPNNKRNCYKYSCNKDKNIFHCSACSNKQKKTWISAKLHQDSDGNEYLITNELKHVCAPRKYSSIVKPGTVILEKSGFNFVEAKKKEIDERQIVRFPKFELRRNIQGVPERRLIVFCDEERKLCYDYRFEGFRFVCKKCNVSAKILQNDEENSNEKYVILSENAHKCEPVKYVPEKKDIESKQSENGTSANFMVFNRDDENKPTKLIIFTSSKKDLCYEYSYIKYTKMFRCCGCNALHKIMSAKLLKSDDGKEFVRFLRSEHVCTPKKFVLEDFEPKIVPENAFKFCPNKKGIPNSKIILFDFEKDGFVYEYSLAKGNVYKCLACKCKNITVLAKLLEKENGEKSLQLSSTQHVCKSKNSKNLQKKMLKTNLYLNIFLIVFFSRIQFAFIALFLDGFFSNKLL